MRAQPVAASENKSYGIRCHENYSIHSVFDALRLNELAYAQYKLPIVNDNKYIMKGVLWKSFEHLTDTCLPRMNRVRCSRVP
jgi:hypothetical protein